MTLQIHSWAFIPEKCQRFLQKTTPPWLFTAALLARANTGRPTPPTHEEWLGTLEPPAWGLLPGLENPSTCHSNNQDRPQACV